MTAWQPLFKDAVQVCQQLPATGCFVTAQQLAVCRTAHRMCSSRAAGVGNLVLKSLQAITAAFSSS
jgi:hypothetical protein